MKHVSICKSECGTWYVIALVKDDEGYDYNVVFEGNRKKDCSLWIDSHFNN